VSNALDRWLPDPHVRTCHRRTADAGSEAVWAEATRIRLADTRRLGKLVGWRIPGVEASETYHQLFREYPFTVLEQTDTTLISGLCGRIWTIARDYPALDGPEHFAQWQEPGTVRVAFAHWVAANPDGGAALYSEARVHAIDTQARLRLKAIWALLGPFERLVGAEPLELAVRRAENPA
jgi:hypothetical protein